MEPLPIKTQGIPELCRRWRIREFALIGSVLRQDFGAESDVDVLLTFEPESTWSLLDIARLQEELQAHFGRRVDILEEQAIRNPYMLASVRGTKRVLYAA